MCLGGDSHEEGLACYRLGNALQGIGDYNGAIEVRKHHLEEDMGGGGRPVC